MRLWLCVFLVSCTTPPRPLIVWVPVEGSPTLEGSEVRPAPATTVLRVVRGDAPADVGFEVRVVEGRFLERSGEDTFMIHGEGATLLVTVVRVEPEFELELRPQIRRSRRAVMTQNSRGYLTPAQSKPFVDHRPRYEVREGRTPVCHIRHKIMPGASMLDVTLHAQVREGIWTCRMD